MSSTLPRFHSLRVADLRRETPDAVSIAFEVPEALRPLYGFRPGQYLTPAGFRRRGDPPLLFHLLRPR